MNRNPSEEKPIQPVRPLVICVGGSATIDQIFLVEEVKLPSAKIAALDFVETGGGMGANGAVAVQRLGGQAVYWGRVGEDETGDQVIALLAHEGVDVGAMQKLPGFRTKIASILIDRRGERLVVSSQPQGYPPDPAWLPLDRVGEADAVLADTRWPAGAASLFDAAFRAGKPSVFDGDGGEPKQVQATAQLATHPFYSETMLSSFGFGAPESALPRVFGGRNVACGVTLGGKGVRWYNGRESFAAPAPRVDVVDTLAAGDTWHGAFALALAEHRPLDAAIDFATAAAALKCTLFGGRAGIPTRQHLERWMAERGV
jgi:sulfofructose kinase